MSQKFNDRLSPTFNNEEPTFSLKIFLFLIFRLKQLIGSLKDSVDQSGNLTAAGLDILSLINNLEYISDVVQCVAAKSE
jgi:hypothetical protein